MYIYIYIYIYTYMCIYYMYVILTLKRGHCRKPSAATSDWHQIEPS